MSTHTLQILF